jgi:hypothetical protein
LRKVEVSKLPVIDAKQEKKDLAVKPVEQAINPQFGKEGIQKFMC